MQPRGWRVHQRRKGEAKVPYISHLLVASLVAEATEGKDPNLVVAAFRCIPTDTNRRR
jgi:hypothetical protein